MPDNRGRNAQDTGYEVRQLDGPSEYGDAALDSSWRNKTAAIRGDVAGDVQARELAENDIVREARRKIMEILGDDDEPPARRPQQQAPQGRVRRKNSGLSLDDLSEGLDMGDPSLTADHGMTADELASLGVGINDAADRAAVDLVQRGYTGDDDEATELAESISRRPRTPAEPTWDWVTIKGQATLASGKKVPVWMVENKTTGMEMKKPFRIQAPAERIASILNVVGNVNDPRIKQIHEDYDQYVSLTKQLRKAKQLYESGNRDAGRTGQKVAAQLRGVKQRLGI